MNVETAKKFEDLLSGPIDPAPYDYAMLFKADGFFARQRSKNRFKLLKGIDAKLRQILRPDERVFFMTPGTTVSVGEHFFVGWVAHLLNLRALVFTTDRVLLLAISSRHRAERLVSQIPYTAIASVASTWSGVCRVKLLNKQTLDFQQVPKADRKFLADFLAGIVKGTNAPFERVQGLEHLCPHCYTMVPAHPPACPACRGGFKQPNKAALLSFIFPGVGDWYLGHRWRAVMQLAGATFLWLGFVIFPLLALLDPEYERPPVSFWATNAVILLVAHTLDAVMTRHFALKGHHPHGPAPAAGAVPLPLRT
ncbi:hypothetical protein [Opitutus sp. GAS368]|jgi:hypothetical protein|uniref:hypothetical protein n=1 Tax=Opitutus sp. GAS368 TaxID=1882749 RepID=UPI00087DD5CD|nr:hypothetical protein [Opitutus sp. GAS368]SDS58189.1 hypothetical protein SAMN05444173_3323 [Opitutus sp. GAS368]